MDANPNYLLIITGTVVLAVTGIAIALYIAYSSKRELTIRTQGEEAISESEERYRAIFEQAADSIVVIDAETGELVEFNDRAHENLGYTREELKELKIPDFEVIESAEEVAQHLEKITKEGSDNFETKHRTKNGEIRDIQVSSRDISLRGKNFVQSIWRDITKRKRAEEELEKSHMLLRKLSAHLQSVREEEKGQISREIHDELGQRLTALQLDLAWIDKRLHEKSEQLAKKMVSMNDLLESTSQLVEKISAALRPGILDDLGLAPAIEWQVDQYQDTTGIPCELAIIPEDFTLDRERSTAIFRILQESLTNVVRHADATKIRITVERTGDRIALEVVDNGKGITKEDISGSTSMGLLGMRERLYAWDGKFKISGRPGKGTTVSVKIPITENRRSND